jgi:hypothetical protein
MYANYNPFFGDALADVFEARAKRKAGERSTNDDLARKRNALIDAQNGQMAAMPDAYGEINPFAVQGNGIQVTPEMLQYDPRLLGGGGMVA